jgi:predicted dithiol-disulfide oxidoreductase (DUF899 family)
MSIKQKPHLVSREEWLKNRRTLLDQEKAFTRARDTLNKQRQQMPWVSVDRDYSFDGPRARQSLSDLFGQHEQLIIYHFMFGPDWEEGCPSCSFWCDHFDNLSPHLAARNTAFSCISTASIQKIEAYRQRMGWAFNWMSDPGGQFGIDFGVTFENPEMAEAGSYNYTSKPHGTECPGLSVFNKLEDGTIAHSYSTYSRGLDILNTAYHLLDMTPKGRDEEELPYTMSWLKRRDQY